MGLFGRRLIDGVDFLPQLLTELSDRVARASDPTTDLPHPRGHLLRPEHDQRLCER
jgi:hypothetical protein